jgi:protein O-mannosyl-transferase
MRLVTAVSRGLPGLLALATGVAFWPSLGNGFVEWDDQVLIADNLAYRGLGWREIRWAFGTMQLGHYVPLAWLSFSFDYAVWGVNPFGYHLTNLLLHVTTALLLYALVRRLLRLATSFSELGRAVGGGVAALFFAIHPLRVESVAWVTERRDVLSGALFVATILLHLCAIEAEGARRAWSRATSVALYALSLAAKSSGMTLPLVLILLDIYPLRRLPGGRARRAPVSSMRVLLEKAPYLVLAVAAGTVAYYAQTHEKPSPATPWSARLIGIFYSLWFYVVRTVFPVRLSPRYEAPVHVDLLEPRFLAAVVGTMALSLLALWLRRRWPAGLSLWAYYGLVLAPMSGVMPLASTLAADRYSYLSCLGWALGVGLIAATFVDAAARGALGPWRTGLAFGALALWLTTLGTLTWRQTQIWHDSERLWRHAVAVTPECTLCRINLGNLLQPRQPEAALEQFQTVLALRPDRVGVRANLAWTLARLGRHAEAADQYRLLLAHDPGSLPVRSNLAVALLGAGQRSESIELLRGAVAQDGAERMAAFFRESAELRPTEAIPRLGLVQAYLALGQLDLARREYQELSALDSDLARLLAPDLGVAGTR